MNGMKFKPDYSLIEKWDSATNNALPLTAPFVSQFNLASKRLHYLAACHGGDLESPTLKTVRREFDLFRPDVVILEGMPNTGEVSPSWYLDHCRSQAEQDFAAGGEASYATVLAGERGIAFVSGEPSGRDLYDGLNAQGFSLHDHLGFNASVVIKHHLHSGIVDDAGVAALVENQARSTQHDIGIDDAAFTFDDFRAWYRDRMGSAFSLEHLAATDVSPSDAPDANILQKIMSAADNVRDPHILKTIAQQLETHAKVLVVYGSAHLGKQQPVLQKMLGPAQHSKPF